MIYLVTYAVLVVNSTFFSSNIFNSPVDVVFVSQLKRNWRIAFSIRIIINVATLASKSIQC